MYIHVDLVKIQLLNCTSDSDFSNTEIKCCLANLYSLQTAVSVACTIEWTHSIIILPCVLFNVCECNHNQW